MSAMGGKRTLQAAFHPEPIAYADCRCDMLHNNRSNMRSESSFLMHSIGRAPPPTA